MILFNPIFLLQVSAAAALVGVQDQNTAVVSIPVHAAAAMMQIQGSLIVHPFPFNSDLSQRSSDLQITSPNFFNTALSL